MYNNQIADSLSQKYGREALILYCKMEADNNRMLDEDFKKRNLDGLSNDFAYDAEWWEKKHQELTKDLNKII